MTEDLRVTELFGEALELSVEERVAHLDRTCGVDTALRQRVELLLASHADSRLEVGVRLLDRYKILGAVGAGGFGEVYRAKERAPERGGKPGFYVVVSRSFIAENEDVSTGTCAPVYSAVLGLSTEVVIGPDEGLPKASAIRCDFLTLIFKEKLTGYVSTLAGVKISELNRALAHALEIG